MKTMSTTAVSAVPKVRPMPGELAVEEHLPMLAQEPFEPIFRVFAAVPLGHEIPAKPIALTVARGLAAQINGRIMLIDARLDLPPTKSVTEAPSEWGLSDALSEGVAWQETHATQIEPGLSFLPRGSAPALAPAQIRTRLAALLSELSSSYAVVVLLCDPVTDSLIARSIAGLCEKALLLAQEDITLMSELNRSREILNSSLVSEVEVILDRPHVSWTRRILGPIYQPLAALGAGFAWARRSTGSLKGRLKPDYGKPTTFPWPGRPREQEPGEGS